MQLNYASAMMKEKIEDQMLKTQRMREGEQRWHL